jgi:hypothetical protein
MISKNNFAITRYMVHPDAKRWFITSNFHKTDHLEHFLNDAMTYAMVGVTDV